MRETLHNPSPDRREVTAASAELSRQAAGAQGRPPARVMRAQPGAPGGHTVHTELAGVAALARGLRLGAGLSQRGLARRSAVAKSTITRLEAGQLKPRASLLSAVALGINPDRQRELAAELAAAAGDAIKAEGEGWWRYRQRRLERGILAGTTPLPATLETALRLHRAADVAWSSAMALLHLPETVESLREADRLFGEAARLRAQAGPPVSVRVGKRRITGGMRYP
jgi:hypothetical protein